MEWLEDKIIWFLGTFSATILGGIVSVSRLFQRVKHLEENKEITHERIDRANTKLDRIDARQNEVIGKLDILINLNNKKDD